MTIDFRELAKTCIRCLTPYQPGKPVEEVERELGIYSSIKLASNENPLGASKKAMTAMEQALDQAHIYPDGSCYAIKQALAKHLSLHTDQITMGNGSENILELIVKAYLTEKDSAVISEYSFLTIPIILQSYGIPTKVAQAKRWGHYVPSMLQAIDNTTRALFLVNPNNPTGTYTHQDDFHLLMQSVPPDVIVVVDQAYSEYITQPDYPDMLEYLARYPNLIITRTFSKVYGLAALRLGYALSSPDIADILNRARLPFNVNSIASKAGIAALSDQVHVTKSVLFNQQGLQQLTEELDKHHIDYIPSIANFITIDVRNGMAMYQNLLREGVIVRPLHAYNMPRHIRVTIGTYEQNERFLKAMHQLLTRTALNANAYAVESVES